MKKVLSLILPIFAMLCAAPAMADMHYYAESANNCDEVSMLRQLDAATASGRATTTEIKCSQGSYQAAPAPHGPEYNYVRAAAKAPVKKRAVNTVRAKPCANVSQPVCDSAPAPVARVIGREYFVRETVAVYKPVVSYVLDGTYETVRPVCGDNKICE